MEKLVYANTSLENQRKMYQKDLSLLESTEGFPFLTEKQKKIIRVSLLIQARAERDLDPKHKNDPWYYDWFKFKRDLKPAYRECQEHIKNWYCHSAVASLENGCLAGERPPEHPKEFFDANYFEVRCEYELERAINFIGYPAVVHANLEKDNFNGEDTQYHTFLALGHNAENNIVVWEKAGFDFPYRVTDLSTVYEDYRGLNYWGVRKLR